MTAHEATVAQVAKISISIIEHMAERVGVSFGEALIAVATTENGKRMFDAYMEATIEHVRQGAGA